MTRVRTSVNYDEEDKEITISLKGPGRMTGKQFQEVMARYYNSDVTPIIARSIRENFEVSIELLLDRIYGIQKIPKLDYFTRMPRDRFCNLVKTINLSHCSDLKDIDRLAVFINLESIDISDTKIKSFPKELCGLGNLKIIKHNVLTNITVSPERFIFPDEFTNITSLEVLELKNYKDYIKFNDNFTVLDRTTNKGLFNLKKLTLTGSNIADFPQNLDNLETLTDLELANCRFGTLSRLRTMDKFYLNRLDDPTIVEGVINTIKNIPNLEKLRLSSTAIKSLFRVNDGDFTSLRVLNLSEIGFEEIDLGIFNLTNLTTLTFQGNKLSNIPEEISNLVNLVVLDLGTNQITSLPDSMGQLVNLKTLYLDDNNLDTLPSTFVNLVNITALNVRNNNSLTENIENICEDLGEEVPRLEIVPSDSSNTMDIFKLFDRTGCPQRPLVIRSLNSQYNKGTFPRDFFVNFTGPNPARLRGGSRVMTVPLISEDTQPDENLVNLLTDMGFSENAAKKAALINFNNEQNAIDWLTSKDRPDIDEPLGDFNFLQQTLLLIEDLFFGRNMDIQGRTIPLKMLLIYGFFRVRYVDNPGIDAGGLYRQYITDMSKYFEEENDMVFKRQGSGKIVVNKDTPKVAEKLTDVIGILIMIYNTGYGSFTSSFKFGHAITLYQGVFPDKNIFESKTAAGGNLENVVKDFAIKILDEPEERVNTLDKTHIRLLTYLWLMAEYIDNDMGLLEGMNCTAVKTHNMGGESPMYDYIFMEADFPDTPIDINNRPNVTIVNDIAVDMGNQNRNNVVDIIRNNFRPVANNALPMPPGANIANNQAPLSFEQLQARFLELRQRMDEGDGSQQIQAEVNDLRNELRRAQGVNQEDNQQANVPRINPMNNFPNIPENLNPINEPERRLEDMELDEFINYIEENSARLVEINQGPFPLTPELLNEFETIRSRRPRIEDEVERRFPQEGFSERGFQHQEDFMTVEEPLGRFISNIASVEMSQAEQNNSGSDGVDLVELRQRLVRSGIDIPETQSLLDDIDAEIANPIDPEALERRVNEFIVRNSQPVRPPPAPARTPTPRQNNNNSSDGVDLDALIDRLQAANISTPEAQSLMDNLNTEIANPVDPENLERRVNELIARNPPQARTPTPVRTPSPPPPATTPPPIRRPSPPRVTIDGEDQYPEGAQIFDRRHGPGWRTNPSLVRSFTTFVNRSRREHHRRSVARDRNTQSIANLPYLNRYMSEDPRYGPNWRDTPSSVTAFRRLATTERRQDNEAIATRNPNALAVIEGRFGRDWRESMAARRELRRLDRRSGRRGGGSVQRGGANLPFSNSNSNDDLLYYKTLASTYEVEDIIIEEFKKFINLDNDIFKVFVDNSKESKPRESDNVFLFNAVFNPRSSVDIEKLLSLIQFDHQITETTQNLVKSMLTDVKEGLSEEDIREIDGEIARLLPEDSTNNSLESLFPNQELFVKKFLEYTTGSRTLNEKVKVFYRDRENLEAHTCFNELVMNNFDTKKDLVKIFITSLLLGGETFGVGKLRRRTMKKNRNNNRVSENRISENRLSERDFKKYLSKRMKKVPGSKKKGAIKKKRRL